MKPVVSTKVRLSLAFERSQTLDTVCSFKLMLTAAWIPTLTPSPSASVSAGWMNSSEDKKIQVDQLMTVLIGVL